MKEASPPRRFRLSAGLFLSACAALAVLYGQERFRRTPPLPEPMPSLRLPNIETLTLSNGLRLAVVFREGPPLISLQLVILAGENSSPPGTPGTAAAAARMFSRGTRQRSWADIEERLDALGGNLSVNVQQDSTVVAFTFLEESLDDALALLAEMILWPAANEPDWQEVRRGMSSALLERETDPDFIGRRLLLRQMYRDQAVHGEMLSPEMFRAIRLKDISEFVLRYYRPNNALLVLAGNVSLRTAARTVSHHLNTWKAGSALPPAPSPPKPGEVLRVCFVDVPGSQAATIWLGNIIPPLSSSDAFPLLVFNQVLGGTPNSRLFLNLRESKAYAYYAFSEVAFQATHGIFLARARVRPEAVPAAIGEILREIRRAMVERIMPSEIEQAKSYLIGNFPLTLESLESFSARVAALQAYRLGEEQWGRYVENIMLVSAEAVQAAVQKLPLLTPLVVVAGEQASLLEALRSFEKVEVYDKRGNLQYSLVRER